MKLLLSAYACEPYKGSEPGIGWQWVRQAARFHEVWVITRASNRAAIEVAHAREPMPNVHWLFVDLPPSFRRWKAGRRGLLLYYCIWQLLARRAARALHAEVSLDAVQHVTFSNYWLPAGVGGLPLPFIWGPVGGGETGPNELRGTFSRRGRVHELVRIALRQSSHLNLLQRRTAKRASRVLAATPESAAALSRLGAPCVEVLPSAALTEDEIERLASIPLRHGTGVRFVSIGSLLHWKGYHLAVRAFAQVADRLPGAEYWLVGGGPERRDLERLIQHHGLASRVCLLGQLQRERVAGVLADCDVLLHPSVHDSGGFACLEAMAAGRPVICLDEGGPGVIVTDDCGIKVRADQPDQVVTALANAMHALGRDRELRENLARAARTRVREAFTWDSKGDYLYGASSTEFRISGEPAATSSR